MCHKLQAGVLEKAAEESVLCTWWQLMKNVGSSALPSICYCRTDAIVSHKIFLFAPHKCKELEEHRSFIWTVIISQFNEKWQKRWIEQFTQDDLPRFSPHNVSLYDKQQKWVLTNHSVNDESGLPLSISIQINRVMQFRLQYTSCSLHWHLSHLS